jgi:hypothetical protein
VLKQEEPAAAVNRWQRLIPNHEGHEGGSTQVPVSNGFHFVCFVPFVVIPN